MTRRAVLGAAAALAFAATLTPLTMNAAAASTSASASTSHPKPWGTNPKKQPKPVPWYHTVWSDEFSNPADQDPNLIATDQDPNLKAFQSWKADNDLLSPADDHNAELSKPTLKANVSVVKAGHDNKALQVATQSGTYVTSQGLVTGITNGRVNIGPEFSLGNHVVSIRLRAVGGSGGPGGVGKSATMIWPTTDWPWEFDLAETIPGVTGVAAYHHIESQPGNTVWHFLPAAPSFNPYAWHTYTIQFLGGPIVSGIQYLVDGKPLTFIPEDGKPVTTLTGAWIPSDGTGHVAIGKALPAGIGAPYATRNDVPSTYFDAVQVDWVQILAH